MFWNSLLHKIVIVMRFTHSDSHSHSHDTSWGWGKVENKKVWLLSLRVSESGGATCPQESCMGSRGAGQDKSTRFVCLWEGLD